MNVEGNSPSHVGDTKPTCIKLVDDKEARFDVSYKIFSKKPTILQAFKQKLMQLFYAKIKDSEQQEIWVNVKSVSKKLGLSRRAVRKLIKNEGLDGLKHAAEDRWRNLKVVEEYKPQVASFLTHRKALTKKGIHLTASSKTVHKVIAEGLKLATGSTKRLKAAGYTFRVTKAASGKVDVAAKVAVIGRGAFKEVSKYLDLGTAKTFAMMKAKASSSNVDSIGRETRALRTECAILNAIYANRESAISLPGLQSPPHAVYTITKVEKGTTKEVGFMEADLYDGGDLWNLISSDQQRLRQLSIKDRLGICLSLAQGCAALHERGIVHRDIKPENIMLKLDPEGKVAKADIIDFGLAVIVDTNKFTKSSGIDPKDKPDLFKEEMYRSLAGTPEYIAVGDFHVDIEKDDETRRAGRYKQDIFGLGRTYIEFITGTTSYFKSGGAVGIDAIDTVRMKADLKKAGINEPLLAALITAVSLVASKRPSAEELVAHFKSATASAS